MKITLAEARKLLKELKKKYKCDCSVNIVFNSWSGEYINTYVAYHPEISSIKKYFDAESIRRDHGTF